MVCRDIALKMAIRHPRVGEILSNPIDDDGKVELAIEYGLIYKEPFSFGGNEILEFRHVASRTELCDLYPSIREKDLRFNIGFDSMILVSNDKDIPTKLLPQGQNKGGLMIENIDFDWYDHVKIHGNSEYSLDPSRKQKDQIKKNIDILHDYIMNKRWGELLQI